MKKLERRWLRAANWLTGITLGLGILSRLTEGTAVWVCLVLFVMSLAAAGWVELRHLRCPGCGKTSVPPWTSMQETRHCPRCGTKFLFEDEPRRQKEQ